MTKRMLIDATHREETRVAVVESNKLQAFDFETSTYDQIKGNIYLAKVTRVEPSLQAAFVDYGGNRHGFLPFPEIHPDYYRIPVKDRDHLIKKEKQRGDSKLPDDDMSDEDKIDYIQKKRPKMLKRRYKIQEVIEKGQILLIQITREERGTKGAAMTTYISLPGRYTVLMPNSPRGGGVSRKIDKASDRKRMKEVLSEMAIPDGMSCIIRTAGVERTKAEIKRDMDYLKRLWNNIRQDTLDSVAPELIYEEGNLAQRAIRDIYDRDTDEVLVAGEDGHREVKSFMKTMIPSHARKVKYYQDDKLPLFYRYQVEHQIDEIYTPEVELESGGYIVINPTEALVSIDVNSGRSTRERNVEKTAVHTNREAAVEVARQLRLRDLGGLVVIDFIDMRHKSNNRKVEKALKDAVKVDRARIQLGRISDFGLLELSRQRLRPSLTETSFNKCPHCQGNGVQRSIESCALHILREVEEEGIRDRSNRVTVTCPPEIGLYILNEKRHKLNAIEARYGIQVIIEKDDGMYHHDFELEYETAEDPFIPGLALREEMEEELESTTPEPEPEPEPGQSPAKQPSPKSAKKQDAPAKPGAPEKEQPQQKQKKQRQQDNKKPKRQPEKEKELAMAGGDSQKKAQKTSSGQPSSDDTSGKDEPVVGKTADDQPGVEVNKKPEKPKRGWWQGLLSGMK